MAIAPEFTEFDYVLKEDRDKPKEDQTVFRLKPLTFREQQEISRTRMMAGGIGTDDLDFSMDHAPMDMARKVLNMGLVDWSNFRDRDGKEVRFQVKTKGGRRELTDKTLNYIVSYWSELANAITESSKLEEATAKNSGLP